MNIKFSGYWFLLVFLCVSVRCASGTQEPGSSFSDALPIVPAAHGTQVYFPLLEGKTIALVANPTSRIGEDHLLDTLLSAGIDVDRVLAPEHGFRGEAEAGEYVESGIDERTGVRVVSIYGANRKPSRKDLEGVDLVLFDIQDVGVRFYTYISTMHLVMERCAEMDIPFMVLDRPNPNGHYVDGPVLEMEHQSFVGMHPVPLVHGMTPGEFALMINGERWLNNGDTADLTVIPVENYTHGCFYELPVPPSPNLPNMTSVYLYPSLGLFEGTIISIGRGTPVPFQVVGHPHLNETGFTFTPKPVPGASMNPKHNNRLCNGWDLRDTVKYLNKEGRLHLGWLINTYNQLSTGHNYFNSFFYKLAGNSALREQVEQGWSEEQIRESWQKDLEAFMKIREKYLIYPEQ